MSYSDHEKTSTVCDWVNSKIIFVLLSGTGLEFFKYDYTKFK